MSKQKDTSFHGHTKFATIYRTAIDETEITRKDLLQLKISGRNHSEIGNWGLSCCTVKIHTFQVKVKAKVKSLSQVRLFETPWMVAYQSPLSMGFSRQEYWVGLPFSSPGDVQIQGSNLCLLKCQVDSLSLSHLESPYMRRVNFNSEFLTQRG